MGKIIFITGGARSGKSSFALNMASELEGGKAFIATAQALDEEMRERIERHRMARGREWKTIEEPIEIAEAVKGLGGDYSAAIIDCITLWLSNLMMKEHTIVKSPLDPPLPKGGMGGLEAFPMQVADILQSLEEAGKSITLYIVSNEVGMGIVPENEIARRFRDYAGTLNRKIAEAADEVFLMVSGIPMRIK